MRRRFGSIDNKTKGEVAHAKLIQAGVCGGVFTLVAAGRQPGVHRNSSSNGAARLTLSPQLLVPGPL